MKNHSFFLTILLLFSIYQNLTSQQKIGFKFSVIDSNTLKPIPYSQIILQKKQTAGCADQNGLIIIFLNNYDTNDTLIIGSIGYETKRIPINFFLQDKQSIIELNPKPLLLAEVKIYSEIKDVKKFIRLVVANYWKNRIEKPHISLAHYREKAKKNDKYIMFTESIGYAIYMSNKINAAPLANYAFYYKNTRKANPKTDWTIFTKNLPEPISDVLPGGDVNLNCFRMLELTGVLSKNHKKYEWSIDTFFFENNRKIYRLKFKSGKETGTIEIDRGDYRILQIDYFSNHLWSTAFHKRVWGKAHIEFSYYNNHPFLSFIETHFKKQDLEYWNNFSIILQKIQGFSINKNEFWAISNNSLSPFVDYSSKAWNDLHLLPDKDFSSIRNDLEYNSISLEQQYIGNSGKYFILETNHKDHNQSRIFIQKLESLF